MRNKYLKSLNKIEFVVTYACTGRCKHCSEGDHSLCGESIDTNIAVDAVRRIAAEYDIKTVMTFGGEPLLCAGTVCEIMRAARDMRIERRQIITNGYFSSNEGKIAEVVRQLAESGANDILLSVDAFHQETIPLDIVRLFASEVGRWGIPLCLQPAWLVDRSDSNPYNEKTRAILDGFSDMDIPVGEGNIIFPEGNALKHLAEYFENTAPENPYVEDPCDVRCLSFCPNGDVLSGNVYREDIMDIVKNYVP